MCLWEQQCQTLYKDISEAVQFLDTLHETYTKVSYKTNSLYRACEQLLADQTKLLNVTECIENRLSYFDDVDRFSKVHPRSFWIRHSACPLLESLHHTTGIRYQTAHPNVDAHRRMSGLFRQSRKRHTHRSPHGSFSLRLEFLQAITGVQESDEASSPQGLDHHPRSHHQHPAEFLEQYRSEQGR